MNYGINYMGSKNVIAPAIVQYVISSHPDKDILIDACCGGFAISHYALRETGMKVYANDLNPYIMDLYDELFVKKGAAFGEVKGKWVSRARYLDVQHHPEKYPKWFVGYVLTNWSFGGRGDSYLYAADKEPFKRGLFEAIYNDVWDPSLDSFYASLPSYIKEPGEGFPDAKRRGILCAYKKMQGGQMQLENATRMERLETMAGDVSKCPGRLSLSAMDYKKFILSLPQDVLSKAVVYLDPPYENTTGYYVNDIDYRDFWGFVDSLKDRCPVYVSSYGAPDSFKEVWSAEKRINMNNGNGKDFSRHSKVERLFYNGYAGKEMTLSDLFG